MSDLPAATPTACEVCVIPVPADIREETKPHTEKILCVNCFSHWWNARPEAGE
jgi:hypothetical protein